MKQIKIIILDFDGTLGDTASVIINTMQATIRELGLKSRTNEQCAAMIGLRLVEIPAELYPGCNIDPELFASTYRRLFNNYNTQGAVKLYPGVYKTLQTLKEQGLTLTIASSRSHASLDQYVRELGLSSIISLVLGADDVKEGKPQPEAIFKTLEKFGFSADQALMVGDSIFDIRMGINAGTRTCGVSYGNGTRESLSPADRIIDDFREIINLINFYN